MVLNCINQVHRANAQSEISIWLIEPKSKDIKDDKDEKDRMEVGGAEVTGKAQ